MRRPVTAALAGLAACFVMQGFVGAGVVNTGGSVWVARVGAFVSALVGSAVAGGLLERPRSVLTRFSVVAAVPPAVLLALSLLLQLQGGADAAAAAVSFGLWFTGAVGGAALAWRLADAEGAVRAEDVYRRR
jgi:hypothetical protein